MIVSTQQSIHKAYTKYTQIRVDTHGIPAFLQLDALKIHPQAL